MGQVPNRTPVYMSEIAAALGGTYDLAWYRGRQYWNAGGAVVYISQNPAMSEFIGITNVSPVPFNGTLYARDAYFNEENIMGFSTGNPYVGWAFGDLQPRYVSTLGTNIVATYSSQYYDVQNYIMLGVSGSVGNGGFSAWHIPNVLWLDRANASFGNYGTHTEWLWFGAGNLGYTDYNLRLEA